MLLVQNMESLAGIMGEKIGDRRYRDMLSLLFNEHLDEIRGEGPVEGRVRRKGTAQITETVELQRTHFQIHEVLTERRVQATVRMRVVGCVKVGSAQGRLYARQADGMEAPREGLAETLGQL